MRNLALIALGVLFCQNPLAAQATNGDEIPASGDGMTGKLRSTGAGIPREFTPLTASERLRLYLRSSFGPAGIARAAFAGGIEQLKGTPKEWGGGAEAFGERMGSSFAKHVIRKTLEYGAATALREDNRYIRSTDPGFLKRSKHALGSAFVARNDAGREHFAYSRFGSALGSSFISRAWQPRSASGAGDASVSFGITMVSDIGGNFIHEFVPSLKNRFKKN